MIFVVSQSYNVLEELLMVTTCNLQNFAMRISRDVLSVILLPYFGKVERDRVSRDPINILGCPLKSKCVIYFLLRHLHHLQTHV